MGFDRLGKDLVIKLGHWKEDLGHNLGSKLGFEQNFDLVTDGICSPNEYPRNEKTLVE